MFFFGVINHPTLTTLYIETLIVAINDNRIGITTWLFSFRFHFDTFPFVIGFSILINTIFSDITLWTTVLTLHFCRHFCVNKHLAIIPFLYLPYFHPHLVHSPLLSQSIEQTNLNIAMKVSSIKYNWDIENGNRITMQNDNLQLLFKWLLLYWTTITLYVCINDTTYKCLVLSVYLYTIFWINRTEFT